MNILKGATWQNPRGYNPLIAAAHIWQAQHPTTVIEWHQFPWYEFENHVLGRGGIDFDLVMFDHPWTGSLAGIRLAAWDTFLSSNYIDELQERVVPPSTASYQLDEHLWALPLDASCHAGLYRADLIERPDLPTHWEDVATFAQEHHHPPERFGLVLSIEGVLGHCLFLSMMAGLNHPPYLDPQNPTCDRNAAEYVLSLLQNILAFAPPGSQKWGPWDIYDFLTTRDTVGYSPSIFAYANYFGPEDRQNDLRLCPVPSFYGEQSGRPILGGVGLGITTSCGLLEEAVNYGTFLMDENTQCHLFPAHQGQPATLSSWMDESTNIRTHGFYHSLREYMKSAYVRPTYLGFHELELAGGNVLQAFWNGTMTLNETVTILCKPSFPVER